MTNLTDAALHAGVWLTNVTPSPSPSGFGVYTGDEDLVTPGVVGFIITFLIALATVFLVLDMTKRVRRTRYREEVRATLEAEAAAQDAASRTGGSTTGGSTPPAGPTAPGS
jgi:hypothetical protein